MVSSLSPSSFFNITLDKSTLSPPMRMPLTLAVLAAVITFRPSSASGCSCHHLTDSDSPLIQSVATLNGVTPDQVASIPVDEIFGRVDSMTPWLSKCLANIDLFPIVMELQQSPQVRECVHSIFFDMPSVYDTGFSDEAFSKSYCPFYTNVAVPCVTDLLLPAINKALDSTGNCCDDFKDVVNAAVGNSLTETVSWLMELFGNAMCATKGFSVAGNFTEQTCGFSLLSNFITPEGYADDGALMVGAQIPSTELCKAVMDEPFVTTSGQAARFQNQNGYYGICYETVDELSQFVSSFPMLQTTLLRTSDNTWIPLKDLFLDGMCVSGDVLFDWLDSSDGVLMKSRIVLFDVVTGLDAIASASTDSGFSDDGSSWDDVDSSSGSDSWEQSRLRRVLEDNSEGSSEDSGPGGSFDGSWDDRSWAGSWTGLAKTVGFSLETVTQTSVDDPLKSVCLHIPTGVQCDYTGEWLLLVYNNTNSVYTRT